MFILTSNQLQFPIFYKLINFIQVKTTMRYHLSSIKMVKLKKSDDSAYGEMCMGWAVQELTIFMAVRSTNRIAFLEGNLSSQKKPSKLYITCS